MKLKCITSCLLQMLELVLRFFNLLYDEGLEVVLPNYVKYLGEISIISLISSNEPKIIKENFG